VVRVGSRARARSARGARDAGHSGPHLNLKSVLHNARPRSPCSRRRGRLIAGSFEPRVPSTPTAAAVSRKTGSFRPPPPARFRHFESLDEITPTFHLSFAMIDPPASPLHVTIAHRVLEARTPNDRWPRARSSLFI